MTYNLLAVVYPPLIGPGIQPTANPVGVLETIISTIVGVLTIVAVIFFAIQIIFAGYSFISSEGDAKKMEEARKKLTEGVLGVFIVVIALGAAALIGRLTGLGGNVLDLQSLLSKLKIQP
ncbi:MAG: hypothetical protein NTY75_03570 [Candidatus Shapirobacteria bacterium]|nr:hypothetical protein [Candidatus Shapirobacteria bacterium]